MVVAKNSNPQMTHRKLPTRSLKVVVAMDYGPSDGGIASMDRELAMTQALGRGILPGADRQDFVEEPARGRLEGFLVVQHAADVEVDIVAHRLGRPRVPGDLYHGGDRIARRRAEAGCEHD